ncbi:hypothetical protein ACFRFO_25495 [Streptomyces sp. NPDC056664]|uniref:hypothetical protein n=2 Tax=Streptomyces TaxID=1883 RepID=UPI0016563A95|nr:hypothetical protein [Streptomyces sp. CB02980]MCB8905559.1 hypothetical protein [Streptomyces sp. CB02980]
MAGTDPIAEAEADGAADALFVLTAALLTPARFPSVLGDDYPAACTALGLQPYAEGYGLVFGQDGLGARWTVVVDDVSLVAVAISSWDCGMAYDLSPDEHSVVAGLPGWPLAVVTRAPGVPAPHDPEPEEGDPAPLVPPSGDAWGPAQRRLGADEVALQWSAWRSQVTDGASSDTGAAVPSETPVPSESAVSSSEPAASPRTPAEAAPRPTTWFERPSPKKAAPPPKAAPSTDAATSGEGVSSTGAAAAADAVADPYTGVRRALDELRGYLKEPPPIGRVRSSDTGTDGGVRTLRADGPGWSLVARPDDMAFVLLDELPGEVLPVARGPRLPALLEGLDAMAVRPS